MGQFLRNLTMIEPAMEIYELGHREPCFKIDMHGQLWKMPGVATEVFSRDSTITPILSPEEMPRTPKVLFAAVPVMIHTIFGFSLAPLTEGGPTTGPQGDN